MSTKHLVNKKEYWAKEGIQGMFSIYFVNSIYCILIKAK